MTCRECWLEVVDPSRRQRVEGHELVWRTVEPGVEVAHLLLHVSR